MSDQTDREARYAEAASKHRETASYRQGVYACTCGRRFAVAEGSWLGSLMEHVRDENARAVLALADAEQAALRALADVLGQDYERAVAEQAPLRAEVERLNNLVRFYSQQYEASAEREQDAQERLRAVEALVDEARRRHVTQGMVHWTELDAALHGEPDNE